MFDILNEWHHLVGACVVCLSWADVLTVESAFVLFRLQRRFTPPFAYFLSLPNPTIELIGLYWTTTDQSLKWEWAKHELSFIMWILTLEQRGIAWQVQLVIALMMEAVNTSETSENFYQTTRCNIPEDSPSYTPLWEPQISQALEMYGEWRCSSMYS
jgi:hypothetical protein